MTEVAEGGAEFGRDDVAQRGVALLFLVANTILFTQPFNRYHDVRHYLKTET